MDSISIFGSDYILSSAQLVLVARSPLVDDIDLRVTRQEGPGYSYGHCQKPGAKPEDGGPKMGLRPGYGLRPVVTIIIMVELVV